MVDVGKAAAVSLSNVEKENLASETPNFRPFQEKIQHYGILSSLSQTLLKLTAPGLPDIYQGTELWDFSLVIRDNRRPVDFDKRQKYLEEIKSKTRFDLLDYIPQLFSKLPKMQESELFLIYQKPCKARGEYLDLFQRGSYEKLSVVGSLKTHYCGI